jgi:N-acetylneuraminate synthase
MNQKKFMKLDSKLIGLDQPCFLIAEVGQAHDGSLGLAHSFIDAAADVGADAIKFQTHIADAESTIDEQWRVKFSYQDKTRFDYWKRVSFNPEDWIQLSEHAKKKGIIFLSTAFSVEAFEILDKIGVPAWKVASGELSSRFLLEKFIASKKPLIISSGMSSWAELKKLSSELIEANADHCFLQCTSKYPVSLKDIGLNVIEEFRLNLSSITGLSDHSGNLDVLKTAIARGANIVEAHITFDRKMFGPDSSSSLSINEFEDLVNFRDTVYCLDSNPVNKDHISDELKELKSLFTRSVSLRKDAVAGTILTKEMLTLKKPGNGIPESDIDTLIGKVLARNVFSSRLLNPEDFIK